MLIYILKFSACLATFLAFYKLFLEKENMHVFKRFYLLGIVFTSIVIPFITFTQYIEPQPVLDSFSSTTFLPSETVSIATEKSTNFIPIILWSIYGIGVIIFGLKFIVNLAKIILKINKNPKQKSFNFINVLLQDLVTPHTFFSYIFLNKHKYETHQIPQEVLLHEQTHASQKHSLDVLFIEVLQVIFWFNPLIHLLKNSIKLNHEFLADKSVLNNGIQPTNYQHILLAFSANSSEPHLTNAINYSSIKKRLTVMKTQTSKQKMWLRSVVLLPLLALTLYSFSERKVVEKNIASKTSITNHTARSIDIEVFNNGTYKVDDIKATKETFISVINQLHQDITPEIRNQIINIHVNSGKAVSDEEVWFIYNSVIDYGFHRIVTHNQEIIREKGNKPFAITTSDTSEYLENITNNQDGATKEQTKKYRSIFYLNDNNEIAVHGQWMNVEDLKSAINKYSKAENKNQTEIELIIRNGASKNVISKTKSILSQYGELKIKPTDNKPWGGIKPLQKTSISQQQMWILINGKGQLLFNDELATLTSLESLLKKTRKNTEFAVKTNNAPKNIVQKVEALLKKYEMKIIRAEGDKIPPPPPPPAPKAKEAKEVENTLPPPPPPPPIPENATEAQKKKYSEAIENYKLRSEKLAYKEAQLAKLKTEKGELTRVRELKSKEEVEKLKAEKLAYAQAQKVSQEEKPYKLSLVDKSPIYNGCNNSSSEFEIRKCLSESFSNHFEKNLNLEIINKIKSKVDRKFVLIMFNIDENGNLSSVFNSSKNEDLKKELGRILKLVPKLTPGMRKGKNVKTKYNVSINFETDNIIIEGRSSPY